MAERDVPAWEEAPDLPERGGAWSHVAPLDEVEAGRARVARELDASSRAPPTPERIAEVRAKLIRVRDETRARIADGDALLLLYLVRHDEAVRLLARLDASDPSLLALL